MSNHSSIATSGAAASNGHQNLASASSTAIATSAASTSSSTAATRAATVVRGSQRSRHRSTSTSFNGVRAMKASMAAAPSAAPGQDHATKRPSRIGSSVRLQPPCSVGMATARSVERSPIETSSSAEPTWPWTVMVSLSSGPAVGRLVWRCRRARHPARLRGSLRGRRAQQAPRRCPPPATPMSG